MQIETSVPETITERYEEICAQYYCATFAQDDQAVGGNGVVSDDTENPSGLRNTWHLEDSSCDCARKSKKSKRNKQRSSSVPRDYSVASDVPRYVCKYCCGDEHAQYRLLEFEAWLARGDRFDSVKPKPSLQGCF